MNNLTSPTPAHIQNQYWVTTNSGRSAPRQQPPTPYPNDDIENITSLVYQDNTVLIEYRLLPATANELVFTTHDRHDQIRVQSLDNQLVIDINQNRYHLPDVASTQALRFRTQDGDDTVGIDSAVTNPVIIESGAGHDLIMTGGGASRVYAGPGDDQVVTGNGSNYVEAGDGNDDVIALGSGDLTVYGGKGQDRLRGGDANSFIDGGDDADRIIGGRGHNILSGGDGDDWIRAGLLGNTLYSGKGSDRLEQLKADDVAFANPRCTLLPAEGAGPMPARSLPAVDIAGQLANFDWQAHFINPLDPTSSLLIEGSDAFKERVNADLKLLLGSGAGQKLLHALDLAVQKVGAPVTIVLRSNTVSSSFTENPPPDGQRPQISNGTAGVGAPGGTVFYNPALNEAVVHLYHELCHAYNALTGTFFPGEGIDDMDADRPRAVILNSELQAVGLPVDAPAYDFDDDPATPALTSNPEPYTENGIRRELGLPLRKQYQPLSAPLADDDSEDLEVIN